MTDKPDEAAPKPPVRHYLAVTNRHNGAVLINERPGMPVGVDPTQTKAVSIPDTELSNLKALTDAGMISVAEISQEDYEQSRGREAMKAIALSPEAAQFPRERMTPSAPQGRALTVADLMTGAGSPSKETLAALKGAKAKAEAASATAPAVAFDFDSMKDDALKAFIRDRTGEGVQGSPSHETLVTRAKSVQEGLEKGDGTPPSPPAPGDQVQGGPGADVTVNATDAAAYAAAKEAGYPGTLEEWRAAGSPPPTVEIPQHTADPGVV